MSASTAIRRARAEDIPELYGCLAIIAGEGRYLALQEPPPFAESRDYWLDMIGRGYPFQVALAEGRRVGWCDILPHARPVCAHGGLLGIGLLPEARGKGLGRRLLAATIDQAWQRGLERIELTVFTGNGRARRLYESLGFEKEGLLRRHCKLKDEYQDSVLMALLRS